MIKTLLTGIFLILFSTSNYTKALTAQIDTADNYSITGKIRNYNNGWIYLSHTDKLKKDMRTDSALVINGEFSFSGKISGIAPFILGIPNKDKKGKILPSITYKGPFILSSGHLYIEGEFDWRSPLTAFGTSAQDEYNAFKKKADPINKKTTKIIDEIGRTKKSDHKKLDSLNARYPLVNEQIHDVVKAYVIQFPNSLVSAYIANINLVNADPATVKTIYDLLTTTVKESPYGKALLQMIQSYESTAVGRISPSFNIPDLKGQLMSLEANKGSYTLIDFWASWCGPCRMEHPNLIKAYNSYQAKGFKIISISMDTDKGSWLKAINEDQLPWLQVSDLKGIQSETGKKYGITVLPMNFLIDQEGKIIARNLRGTQLMNKLKEVL
ncbi:Thiol-disulfide isomerase or thioredoxin [Pedobacter steynii]|uniref:Thiol-disulfide isomerase or thioredoxin n=1 Tax=Pedobacter steynii TaxID=430522 RepID=A0A1G9UQL4_9SPHI|nr:TlpA disulfide reductase family protein [Pedobacter steynii]NQX40842.1 AhpC/TSA family protein [Pedobacter steynii]SDM62170.1 Thiol-disulfide isomerase or thioredoxin [Pedobacter steynii]